ncbi:MAG: hypothetical protein WC565_05285 [Parcubacteria group bacterium]|jgi:hypothetical protein
MPDKHPPLGTLEEATEALCVMALQSIRTDLKRLFIHTATVTYLQQVPVRPEHQKALKDIAEDLKRLMVRAEEGLRGLEIFLQRFPGELDPAKVRDQWQHLLDTIEEGHDRP